MVIKPTITPNHSVQNLITIVALAAIPLGIPESIISPAKLPSATSNPPGIMDTAPTKEEKEKINVLSSMEESVLKPSRTKYNAKHSNPHDIMLIAIATIRFLNLRRV